MLSITAEATPFYAHPEGQRCLVRFFVSGLDAPAGRMRVFDGRRRQLGTAGVLPLGDGRLYGELWLPLGALGRLRTELEAPGLRRATVTWHALQPAPRWTVHWITLLDPQPLAARLQSLAPIPRAVTIATLERAGAMINPVPASLPTADGDVPFLRLAELGERVAQRTGLVGGRVAALTRAALDVPSLATVLTASGITAAVVRDAPGEGVYWLPAPEGSRFLIIAAPPGAAPGPLGFVEGGDRMVRQVEEFLSGRSPDGADRAALVIGSDVSDLTLAMESVRQWNARFAYPQMVPGDLQGWVRAAASTAGMTQWTPRAPEARPLPTPLEVAESARRRAAESRRRVDGMLACVTPLLPGTGPALERIANQLALPAPGTLVFNPTSYTRTELIRMADGSERMATDIPPLGYAYFPHLPGDEGRWRAAEDDGTRLAVETRQFRLALDADTGAIRSLVTAADGTEWAAQRGVNEVAGATLEAATREELPGVAARIVARRRVPGGNELRTEITAYMALPWIDIVNRVDGEVPGPMAYGFAFALRPTQVEWEIPAGTARGTPPCDSTHLRWLRLAGDRGSALLATRETAFSHVDADGGLTGYGPAGGSRFRIGLAAADAWLLREDLWRFGWGMEPAVTAPVPGAGGAMLPSFGSLLVVDQPGVAIVGLQPAASGEGVIVYLQELGGHSRVATLGAGLISFEDARQVDLVERDIGPPPMIMHNGVGVTLPARGVAAVRLLGVSLAKG